jgi:competence protein ComEC
MRDKIFHTICFGFLLGVLWRSFVTVDIYYIFLVTAISLAVFLFFTLVSRNNLGILVSIFVLAISVGVYRFDRAHVNAPALFESQLGKKADFSGMIIDDPSIREKNQQLLAEVEAGESKTKILISVGLEENYAYGDEINFTGTLKKPENFMTDTGKEFDYVNYLRKDGIFYVMSYPSIEVVSSNNGNFIKSVLFKIKGKFLEKINFAIPSPESLLLGGLILGEKSAFDQDLRQSFIDTGTIHIIALSGYNVTIVAEWFMKLFAFLPLNFAIGMGIFSIILFILMTGASSTAIRAGIMAVLALFARATARNYDVARALILAAVGMVLLNPFLLVFDVSFQLSFIATVAVIFLAPRIEKRFSWITKTFGLRDIVSVTTAAYIFVLPFILYKMGNLSIVALPANFLVLPLIPFTMVVGFLTAFLGLILPLLSVPLGYIAYLLLHYELAVIKFLASLPFASFSLPDFPFLLTLVIYIFFVLISYYDSYK